jgi:hypothetical protein
MITNYMNLFPDKKDQNLKFFRNIKNGAILPNLNVGKDQFAKSIKKVVEYIGLENGNFTSHGVRRSGASNLAENGATVSQLKDIGGFSFIFFYFLLFFFLIIELINKQDGNQIQSFNTTSIQHEVLKEQLPGFLKKKILLKLKIFQIN